MIDKKAYYLDTNILLDNYINLLTLSDNGENIIVLSRTVLSEMDSKKTIDGAVGYNAREFFRLMEKTDIVEKSDIENSAKRIILKYSEAPLEVEIHLVSLTIFDANETNTDPKNLNDVRIIETAKKIMNQYSNFHVLSNDIAFRSNAILDDLDCESFKTDNKKVAELGLYRSYEVQDNVKFPLALEEIHAMDANEDGVVNVCGIELVYASGNKAYGYREGFDFHEVNDDDLRKQIIAPINIRQKILSSMILSDTNDVIVCSSKAGCSMAGSTVNIKSNENFITEYEILEKLKISKKELIYARNAEIVKFVKMTNKIFMYDKNSINYALLKIGSKYNSILRYDKTFNSKYLKLEYWLGFNDVEFSVKKVKRLRYYSKYFECRDISCFNSFTLSNFQKTIMEIQSKMINNDFYYLKDLFGNIENNTSLDFWKFRGYSETESIENIRVIQAENSKKFNDKRNSGEKDYSDIYPNQIKYWLKRDLTEEEAVNEVIKFQTTFSLAICIEKYGVDLGTEIFNLRQEKWQESFIETEKTISFKRGPKVKYNENYFKIDENKNTPAKLYYIKFYNEDIEFWKIGITIREIHKRFDSPEVFFNKYGLNMEIVTIKDKLLYECFKDEQNILKQFKEFRIKIDYNGFKSTECFSKDVL